LEVCFEIFILFNSIFVVYFYHLLTLGILVEVVPKISLNPLFQDAYIPVF